MSYTAPKASDLLTMMNLKGANRKIILTFNSRNWGNYKDQGVIVQWSDGDTATYITKDEATGDLSLDANSWETSPQDIIGERPPFDRTFE
ncbi:MAG: hypothetical protein M5U25_01260 [Planctomycetota bacterium]|nr:hypothetical protein [Planctomycetota bacterium]